MKNIVALMLILLLSSCGKDEVNPKKDPDNTGNTLEKPVAVDDVETTTEDTPVTTKNVLDNDTTPQGTRLKTFDTTSQENGEVIDNRNGTFTYSPAYGFVGVDSLPTPFATPNRLRTALRQRSALRLLTRVRLWQTMML